MAQVATLRWVEWWPVAGGMAWQLPHAGVGGGVVVVGGVTVAKAVAMADNWVAVREERDPMPPMLLVIAVWIWLAVLPGLLEVARGPWQLAQLLA